MNSALDELIGDDELMVMEGYDDCVVGVCTQFNRRFVVYDRAKVLARLARDMSREDAAEFHEVNQAGAWVGDSTPGFVDVLRKAKR